MAERPEKEHAKNAHAKEDHWIIKKVMHATEHAAGVWGPADRLPADTPVQHKHDDFEKASEEELATFEVERDEGHAYIYRKPEK